MSRSMVTGALLTGLAVAASNGAAADEALASSFRASPSVLPVAAQLAQAGPAIDAFDEFEALRAYGRPEGQSALEAPTRKETAPVVLRLTGNPSPGDGFDELDRLKRLTAGQTSGQVHQSSKPVLRESATETEAAAEGRPVVQAPVATQGTASDEARPGETDAKVAARGSPETTLEQVPTLEQEIEQLFEPQPLDDEPGLSLGALPKLGPESGTGTRSDGVSGSQPPAGPIPGSPELSSLPKEEQVKILREIEAINPVVATVGDEKIYWADVTKTARRLPERYQERFETVFPLLLQRIVDLKLLAIEARRARIDREADLRARVAAYEERLIGQEFLRRQLADKVSPGAVRKRYDEVVQSSAARTKIRARHILVPTEEEARAVIVELDGGADFAELAGERSIAASAGNGGSLGQFSVDRMVPAFSSAALQLSPGEYTRVPVQTQFGWHVILLEEGARQEIPDFAAMEQDLQRDVSQAAVEGLLRDLRAKAEIEFFPDPNLSAGGASTDQDLAAEGGQQGTETE